VVELLELQELRVVKALFDVKGYREVAMVFTAGRLVIHLHIIVDSLLIAEMIVILHFAVGQQVVRGYVLFFFFFLVFPFLASSNDLPVFGCRGVCGDCVLLLELWLGRGVTERGTRQLVLFGCGYQVLLGGSAFLICCLSGQLTVKQSTCSC